MSLRARRAHAVVAREIGARFSRRDQIVGGNAVPAVRRGDVDDGGAGLFERRGALLTASSTAASTSSSISVAGDADPHAPSDDPITALLLFRDRRGAAGESCGSCPAMTLNASARFDDVADGPI